MCPRADRQGSGRKTMRRILVADLILLVLLGVAAAYIFFASDTASEEYMAFTSGQRLYDEGRFEEAEEALLAELNGDPDDLGARRTLALVLAAQGDIEGAIAEYAIVVEGDPKDHVTLYRMGILERQIGEAHAAEGHLAAAAEFNPGDASFWDELARTRLQLGWEEEAVAAWGRLLEIEDLADETRKRILVLQGDAYLAAHMVEAAIEVFEAALEIDPSDQDLGARTEQLEGS